MTEKEAKKLVDSWPDIKIEKEALEKKALKVLNNFFSETLQAKSENDITNIEKKFLTFLNEKKDHIKYKNIIINSLNLALSIRQILSFSKNSTLFTKYHSNGDIIPIDLFSFFDKIKSLTKKVNNHLTLTSKEDKKLGEEILKKANTKFKSNLEYAFSDILYTISKSLIYSTIKNEKKLKEYFIIPLMTKLKKAEKDETLPKFFRGETTKLIKSINDYYMIMQKRKLTTSSRKVGSQSSRRDDKQRRRSRIQGRGHKREMEKEFNKEEYIKEWGDKNLDELDVELSLLNEDDDEYEIIQNLIGVKENPEVFLGEEGEEGEEEEGFDF